MVAKANLVERLCNCGEDLDAALWVGARKRDAEGSHMQLQFRVSPTSVPAKGKLWGIIEASPTVFETVYAQEESIHPDTLARSKVRARRIVRLPKDRCIGPV